MATLHLLTQPLFSSTLSSTSTLGFLRNTHIVPARGFSFRHFNKHLSCKRLTVRSALAESDGSPKSNDQADPELKIQTALQELADSFVLPSDYLKKLPQDLRLDLNDAAFDLSNGPVIDELGREMGETILNIARAWELADTSTSTTLVGKLPLLAGSITENAKSAFGKRLVSAGRRFQSMGQYEQGELQKISKAMITSGNLLAATWVSGEISREAKEESRMLKFGELQVALTPGRAYIGAAIALIFGIISWELSQGIQNIPESSLQYANDNALHLAQSLRGALLTICYSSTVLSVCAAAGLVLLGQQLKSPEKNKITSVRECGYYCLIATHTDNITERALSFV